MNTSVVYLLGIFAIISTITSTFGSYIEVPDDFLQGLDELDHRGARLRRQVSLEGKGSEKSGYVNLGAGKNLYDDGKTRLDGSVTAGSQWQRGMPTYNSASVRLDAQRNLFDSGKTQVNANGFAQRNVGTGMSPHDSFGAGLEVSRTLAKGRDGTLEAFGGYQRQWNTPNRDNVNAGIRWRF